MAIKNLKVNKTGSSKNKVFLKLVLGFVALTSISYLSVDAYTNYTRDKHLHSIIAENMTESWREKRTTMIASLESESDKGFINQELLILLKKQEENDKKNKIKEGFNNILETAMDQIEEKGDPIENMFKSVNTKAEEKANEFAGDLTNKIFNNRENIDKALANENLKELTKKISNIMEVEMTEINSFFVTKEILDKDGQLTLKGKRINLAQNELEELRNLYENINVKDASAMMGQTITNSISNSLKKMYRN